jgi:choline dehydrogenase-like flavoprotein
MFDEIIVGAGSAGAVVAARLSEDGSRSVLLVEAGPDYPSVSLTPRNILNGLQLAMDHDWGFFAEMVEGRTIDYARGKVVGGSSAVNGCLALHGIPADYDEWSDLGNTDWSWRSVEPTFRAIEHDMDIVDPASRAERSDPSSSPSSRASFAGAGGALRGVHGYRLSRDRRSQSPTLNGSRNRPVKYRC